MNDLRVEVTGASVTGVVQYRCAACGELMDATEAVFAGEPAQPFHPQHVPQEDLDHGR